MVVTGDAAPGTLVTQELNTLEVEATSRASPSRSRSRSRASTVGTQILAADVTLPEGTTLRTDPEMLVVNVVAAPTDGARLEAEMDTEGAGVVEEPLAESAADED